MKFSSRYTDSKVSSAQLIVEIVCENRARNQEMELPQKFWQLPHWKGYYLAQMKYLSIIRKLADNNEDFDKHLISFVKKNRIWSLKPEWVKNKALESYDAGAQVSNIITETAETKTFHRKKESEIPEF